MFNSFSFCKLNPIKKNFEMYFRAGKTNTFSVFHIKNVKIQSMLWFYVCFNVEIRVIWVKKNFIYDLCTFSMKLLGFSGKKRLVLSILLMFYANKCLILF